MEDEKEVPGVNGEGFTVKLNESWVQAQEKELLVEWRGQHFKLCMESWKAYQKWWDEKLGKTV